jgi:hypothetical protein
MTRASYYITVVVLSVAAFAASYRAISATGTAFASDQRVAEVLAMQDAERQLADQCPDGRVGRQACCRERL